MPTYEYKVLPAPKKGLKGKAIRGTEARFANALAVLMNEMGRDGWEYQRAETLPCEERSTMGSKSTSYQNILVFRRPFQEDAQDVEMGARELETPPSPPRIAAPDPAPKAPRVKLFGGARTSETSDDAASESAPEKTDD